MSNKFRLKQKPTKPNRDSISKSMQIDTGDTLESIIKEIGSTDPSKVKFCEGPYGDSIGYFSWKHIDTDKEFAIRMDAYNVKMSEYTSWKKDNSKAIEKEIKMRNKLKEDAKGRARLAESKHLSEKIKLLEERKKKLESKI